MLPKGKYNKVYCLKGKLFNTKTHLVILRGSFSCHQDAKTQRYTAKEMERL